jgi:hypothetical protein
VWASVAWAWPRWRRRSRSEQDLPLSSSRLASLLEDLWNNDMERDAKTKEEENKDLSVNSATPHVALHCSQMQQKSIVVLLYISWWRVILGVLLPILPKSEFYITNCECSYRTHLTK